ncbi:kinase-like domain-containing protein [Chytriomyces cf. hyalinus JEL632]|nr:kinase-like domain-containing protein [Chytriomyces cf. hyalinus JEL632]
MTQQGARHLLPNLPDEILNEQCRHVIAESEKRAQFLRAELHKLQIRKNTITGDEEALNYQGGFSTMQFERGRTRSDPQTSLMRRSCASDDCQHEPVASLDRRNIRKFIAKRKESRGASIHTTVSSVEPEKLACQQVASDFDFLRSETRITREKIKYKLAEVEQKLDIEQKVQAGIERLWKVMEQQPQTNGANRQYQVEEKLIECQSKMILLSKSRQWYKSLDLADNDLPSLPNDKPFANTAYKTAKRPFSGKVFGKLLLATALPNKKQSRSDTYAVIKVDGIQKVQTKTCGHSRWMEDFVIAVEKGLEIEIYVHEKGGGILAMIWFKLAELETSQRFMAKSEEFRSRTFRACSAEDFVDNALTPRSPRLKPEKSDDETGLWLDLEPGGRIAIKLNLVTEKHHNNTIVRHAPVQKVFPMKGHKFALTRLYHVMKCAVCCDFLVSSQGYQCQACKYVCHKKCQPRVFSNCITLSDTDKKDSGRDQLIQHRIPHRFEETCNLGLNWCCHCGYTLPLRQKECRRCSECGISAHTSCSLLVPNLCGLPTELIDQMKNAIDQAEQIKKEKEIMKAEKANAKEEVEKNQVLQDGALSPKLTSLDERESASDRIEVKDSATTAPGFPLRRIKLRLDDFNLLAVLGKGNFGKVMLAEEKKTNQHYAIKVLKKDFVIEHDEAETTRSEKRVFLTANLEQFPFLVNLHSCFQTETRLYFVMEFVSGGDLMWHIQQGRFTEQRAKFYACEVLLALEYLHMNNITYRDLKLDNILLTLDGHIKIADYGLCKENMSFGATTATLCGTPEFMAPEILKEEPYTRAVDWWALGVLIYEMVLGQLPFPGEGDVQVFDAILHGDVSFPAGMNKDAIDLIRKLLAKDPVNRLGYGVNDAADIKVHTYFKDVNWDAVMRLRIPPPFFPSVGGPADVSNFDKEFTKETPLLTPINTVLSAADQEEFRGFSHISEWAQANRTTGGAK